MELIDILIWVGKAQKPAKGHPRGNDCVMGPTDSGPLYLKRPQWCEAPPEAPLERRVGGSEP